MVILDLMLPKLDGGEVCRALHRNADIPVKYSLTPECTYPVLKRIYLISSGDYDTAVPVVGRDEVGQLAKAFNRMAANLKSLENLRKQLMIDVAHELRTPLTNIRGYLEALGGGVVAPDRGTLSILQEETMRLVALTEDVLKLAKADAALKTLTPEPIDLCRLIYHLCLNVSIGPKNRAPETMAGPVSALPSSRN